jgi:peptide/nickel transport system permease protein
MRPSALRYATRRLALAVPTVAAVVTLSFALIHLAPGDPVTAIAGDGGDEAYYAETRARFGLDRPVLSQYFSYGARVVRGDLGQSYLQGRPVRSMIAERIPATLLLTGSALIFSTLIGIAVAMFGASRYRRRGDTAVSTFAVLLFATPAFWLGQLAILWLALRTGWFPVQGMSDARVVNTGWGAVFDVAHHLVLPAGVLAAQEVAAVARLLRTGLVAELESAHILMARSKGLPERKVYLSHALRRPLLPVLAVIGGRLGQVLSGAVVVEIVFGWPGVGRLLLSAMQNRDVPVVLGVFLLTAMTVIVANLLIDLASLRLDPRIGEQRLGS